MKLQNNYGVLKCSIIETYQISGKSPHFHIHTIADGVHYRVAINIKSQLRPYEVLYFIDYNFQNNLVSKLLELPFGFTIINESVKQDYGLDYKRGNLFNLKDLRPLPDQYPGPNNDLNEKIYEIAHKALNSMEAVFYVFGKRWGPSGIRDKYFKFSPGDGIHDVHMNQGNEGIYEDNNDTWHDGGLIINFIPENLWYAVFFAFQSQNLID
jgi:uncharacterized protein YukJ